jgi:hypothetical protein
MNGNLEGSTDTSIAFVIFQNSIIRPRPLEMRIIQLVSLSSRYRKMTSWQGLVLVHFSAQR